MRESIHLRHESGEIDVFQAIRLLDDASSHDDESRKNDGVVYTPKHIVERMIKLSKPRLGEKILEPSCGRGAFIFGLAEHFLKDTPGHEAETLSILSKTIAGIDIDEHAIEDLKRLWKARYASFGDIPSPEFIAADGLQSQRNFDLILGNPPYVRIQNLSESNRNRLREEFSSCRKGNVDIYYAFIEFSLKTAKRTCLIVPNSWMTNASGKTLRDLMEKRVQLVVDFGKHLVFSPVRAYTSIFLADETNDGKISFINSLPDGTCLGKTEISLPCPNISEKSWLPQSKRDETRKRLGDIAKIHSGLATLSDKTYIFESPTEHPVFNGVLVPDNIVPKLLKLTKMKDFQPDKHKSRVIFPYSNGKAIPERDLPESILKHLCQNRQTLMSRDKGKTDKYEAWYAYGRKQGLNSFKQGTTLFLVPIMLSEKLVPIEIDLNSFGHFLHVSGFVVEPLTREHEDVVRTALSSQDFWDYVLSDGKAWSGKKDYRTIGAKTLREFPLP